MEPLIQKHSGLERSLWVLLAFGVPVVAVVGVWLAGSRPDGKIWGGLVIYGLMFATFPILAFRFVLRVDDQAIYHREWVTRRIPVDEVVSIQVAEQYKGAFRHLKVQIQGASSRIMVAWREGKMRPFVERLRQMFPEQIEDVPELPDY